MSKGAGHLFKTCPRDLIRGYVLCINPLHKLRKVVVIMNGFQGPEHLWFLHEKYFGLFESEGVIMRDSDFSSVFYILRSMERYHSDRPFEYWITYEGNDIYTAKEVIKAYQKRVQFWADEDVTVASYIRGLL